MALKDITVSLYEVINALATDWIYATVGYCVSDDADSMRNQEAAEAAIDSLTKHFHIPTTAVNFVKAYRKTDYLRAFKEYLDDMSEEYDPSGFATQPPIKFTAKDLEKL